MNKETLEEAADNWVRQPVIGTKRESFIAGAKWMQEQMEKLKDFETWKEWKNKTFKSEQNGNIISFCRYVFSYYIDNNTF